MNSNRQYPSLWFGWTAVLVFCLTSVSTIAKGEEHSKLTFNPDGFLVVEGKPRLILGSYELPKEDERLAALAKSGFNLFRASGAASLDRLRQHGLYGWVTLSVALGENDEPGRQRLTQTVEAFRNHRALLAWELPDEALWNVWHNRMEWALWKHHLVLREAIAKAQVSAEARAKWDAMLDKANDYVQRALWQQAEEIEDGLWNALGQNNPHPEAKMSACPADAVALCEAMKRGSSLIRQLDPVHPLWQNHAPRNTLTSLAQFNQMVDIVGCDIYPVPARRGGHSDLVDDNLSAVGAYTQRMAQAAPGKAVWMVLQGFGWPDIAEGEKPDVSKRQRPQYAETRFMAYDALIHGANGLLYWGTYAIEPESELWAQLHRLARELRALEPGIVGTRPVEPPVAEPAEVFGSVDEGPRLMLRQAGEDWVLIVINRTQHGLPFTVKNLPAALEGKTLYRLSSDESHPVRDRQFSDGIATFDVHVYATSRRFEPRDGK